MFLERIWSNETQQAGVNNKTNWANVFSQICFICQTEKALARSNIILDFTQYVPSPLRT